MARTSPRSRSERRRIGDRRPVGHPDATSRGALQHRHAGDTYANGNGNGSVSPAEFGPPIPRAPPANDPIARHERARHQTASARTLRRRPSAVAPSCRVEPSRAPGRGLRDGHRVAVPDLRHQEADGRPPVSYLSLRAMRPGAESPPRPADPESGADASRRRSATPTPAPSGRAHGGRSSTPGPPAPVPGLDVRIAAFGLARRSATRCATAVPPRRHRKLKWTLGILGLVMVLAVGSFAG